MVMNIIGLFQPKNMNPLSNCESSSEDHSEEPIQFIAKTCLMIYSVDICIFQVGRVAQ